ncbi:hypothetical protein [Murinocardiopsis flavida]|uniref:hypothetical protein n=1 Tax=Murinocardiopsis flavida TaxID=645275 RepID=UPI0011B1CB4D|nr:hypothetical protein [Murinocardiopsis flavida]
MKRIIELSGGRHLWDASIEEELQGFAAEGLKWDDRGMVLTGDYFSLEEGVNYSSEDLMDIELNVNDFKVEDEGIKKTREDYLVEMLSRALTFSARVLEHSRALDKSDLIQALIAVGVDDDYRIHGTTVKFFLYRDGFPSDFKDLEKFSIEAVALISILDLPGYSVGSDYVL